MPGDAAALSLGATWLNITDGDLAHPGRHRVSGRRAEMDVEDDDGHDDRQRHEDHREEQVLARALSLLTSLLTCHNRMRCWCGYLSGARRRLFAYGPADATVISKPHHLLPHLNPDWFHLSCTALPLLSWKTGR